MNIVRITSGLGNQIFQYAFYRALQENDKNSKMDISEFKHRRHHNGYELENVFNIKPVYANADECNELADVSKNWLSGIRRTYFKKEMKCSGNYIDEGKLGSKYQPELLFSQNSYLNGYWQTEKYFLSIVDQLRNELTFKQNLDNQNKLIHKEIADCEAVSIHIRRGDYVKNRRLETVGSVCNLEYYHSAIEYIHSNIKHPRFFIFSDDMNWVKANLKIENAYYVNINTGKNSFKDMQLMSLCKHNIIANSSFSWWGAWLNAHVDKIVIAPSIWFRDSETPDIVPENWIKVNVEKNLFIK